jgi:nicotinamide-nucleotide amidase
MPTTISLITIGNELLKGTIINTNAARAGEMLRQHGYALQRVVTIADEQETIVETVRQELIHSQVVLVSGGLGPTKDDITKYTLAEIFEAKEWRWDQPTLDHLEARYRTLGRSLNDLTRRQAWVPDVCEVVTNRMGTAPGMRFRQGARQLYAMPGVPFEMLTILAEEIIPRLTSDYPGEVMATQLLRINGIPESEAAQRMAPLEAALPASISIAYLPRVDGIWLEVSTRLPAGQQAQADAQVRQVSDGIFDLFRKETYTRSTLPLAQLVQESYLEKGLTLAVAESLTGGQVAATLVSISGASRFFKGSITAYVTQVKSDLLRVPAELIDQQGVVSEATALAMATGVRERLQADVGLATTGLAEATNDAPAQAWIAYADAQGSEARHVSMIYDRPNNLDRVTHQALIFALQKVQARF